MKLLSVILFLPQQRYLRIAPFSELLPTNDADTFPLTDNVIIDKMKMMHESGDESPPTLDLSKESEKCEILTCQSKIEERSIAVFC